MSPNSINPAAPRRLPVTVLSGFAGAGKTAMLHHLLRHRAGRQTAVIVSDQNPSESLAAAGCLSRTEEKVVRLATEAGCHELRADLLLEAGRLARADQFDYLLVENPGRAALGPVANTFARGNPACGLDLPRRTRLDTLVTVVDAGCFLADFLRPPDLPADPEAEDQMPRARADVLTEQVEQANVVVLNKTDQVSPADLARLRTLLQHLNPDAHLVETIFGQINPAEVLDAGHFGRAVPAAGTGAAPAPAPAHGISACRFRDERPFHPERLWAFVRPVPAALNSRLIFLRQGLVRLFSRAAWSCSICWCSVSSRRCSCCICASSACMVAWSAAIRASEMRPVAWAFSKAAWRASMAAWRCITRRCSFMKARWRVSST